MNNCYWNVACNDIWYICMIRVGYSFKPIFPTSSGTTEDGSLRTSVPSPNVANGGASSTPCCRWFIAWVARSSKNAGDNKKVYIHTATNESHRAKRHKKKEEKVWQLRHLSEDMCDDGLCFGLWEKDVFFQCSIHFQQKDENYILRLPLRLIHFRAAGFACFLPASIKMSL